MIASLRDRLALVSAEAREIRAQLKRAKPARSSSVGIPYLRWIRGERVGGLSALHARFHAMSPLMSWTPEYQEAQREYARAAFGASAPSALRKVFASMVRVLS